MKKCIVIILLVFFPVSMFSQEEKETPHYRGDEIVVTATRSEMPLKSIGRSVSVINFSDIDNQKKFSVIDLLRDVPGIDIAQNGGTGQTGSVFIRGTKSAHTLIMIDGIEMNDPISPGRSYDFAHLISHGVEQIEIIKGPNSTLYGSDAMGGVINIITKKGFKKPSFSISGETGSYGTYKENIQTSGAFNKFNYSLSLSRLDIEGFSAAGEKYDNKEKDGYGNTVFSGRTGMNLFKDTALNIFFHYINSKTDMDNTGGVFGDDPNYTARGKESYLKSQLKVNLFNKKWTQIYSFSFMNNKRDYLNDFDKDHPNDFIDSYYDSKLYVLDFQNNIFINNMNSFTVGIEYEKEKGDSRYYSESAWGPYESIFPDKKTNILGTYLQDNVNINNAFLTTAGIRYDKHNIYGASTTFQISPVYLIHQSNTKLRASYATGFKAPSLYQLYSQYGDTNLKPEEVKGFDFGIEQQLFQNRIFFSATYFNNYFSNMVDFSSATFKYVNTGEARTSGIEIEADIKPLPSLYVKGFYTYLKAEDKSTGEELLRRAKNKGGITINYSGLNKFNFNINVLFVGKRYDMDFSVFPAERKILDEYTKVNLTVYYDLIKNIQIFSRLENITDADYEDVLGFGTSGRSFYSGFKFVY